MGDFFSSTLGGTGAAGPFLEGGSLFTALLTSSGFCSPLSLLSLPPPVLVLVDSCPVVLSTSCVDPSLVVVVLVVVGGLVVWASVLVFVGLTPPKGFRGIALAVGGGGGFFTLEAEGELREWQYNITGLTKLKQIII